MISPARPRNPLRTYTFRLSFEGDPRGPVAGVRKVSGLSMTVAAHEVSEGGNALHRYQNPDRASWQPITLEQGLALDDSLERWARAGIDFLTTGTAPAEPVKRNVVLEVWDPQVHREDGTLHDGVTERRRRAYLILNAWVSRYNALPALDAMTDEVGLLGVELTHEGWRIRPDT